MGVVFHDEVYSAREVARAVGVPVEQVEALMATGELPVVRGRFVRHGDAVAWGRRAHGRPLRLGAALPLQAGIVASPALETSNLFDIHAAAPRQPALPAAISAAAHLLAGAAAVLLTTVGLGSAPARHIEQRISQPMRLVYLALPGPGGGGGGGGMRQPAPPPPAKREGRRAFSSPLPEREPPPPIEPPRVEAPPPPVPAEALPPIIAPVATSASDDEDRAGVLEKSNGQSDSRGPGDGGGVGNGKGTGLGEGDGSGIGPGSGGGIGGGPYRPGSGIDPPALLREVKPSYTEEARRRGVTGDVVLEIVVRSDGQVGEVRVLDGLGSGLDQRAVDAVRQWRFSPARRMGRPVDVLVEVAVEFRLR
jgi:TonB family protein